MKRGFYITSKSWYADSALANQRYVDEIMFGMYEHDNGTDGEMSIKWYDLGSHGISPKLEAYNDSWEVLASFSDVIQAMAEVDGLKLSVDEFAELLVGCGFEDMTNYKSPYKRQQNIDLDAEIERFSKHIETIDPTSSVAKIYGDALKRLKKI